MIPISNKAQQLKILCEKHKVSKLYLFGSATNENFSDKSDIDLLVTFKKVELSNYFNNYISLKEKLKNLFQRDIDLVEEKALRNPIFINSINNSKKLIYG